MKATNNRALHKITPLMRLIGVGVIVLTSMTIKLTNIKSQSIWFDEGWSAYSGSQTDMIAAANADATNPPLYYMMLHGSTRLIGDSEFALRLFSAWIGVLLIPLAYQLGQRIGAPHPHADRIGLLAALITGAMPLLWWASQEARMYTLMGLQVLVCALAWHGLVRVSHRRPILWLALWVAELAILYTHNAAPIVVIWLNAITLLVWISRRSIRIPAWRTWIVGQLVVIGLWMPYFITRFVLLGEANSAITSTPDDVPQLIAQVWSALWIVPWERITTGATDPALLVVVILTALIALAAVRRKAGRWILIHVLVLTGGLLVALTVLGNEFHGRYLVMVAPLIAGALAVGIASMPGRNVRTGLIAVVGIACAIPIINALDPLTPYRHDDARAMVQHYADTLTAADTVIAWSYADRYDLAYYWNRLGATANRITLPEGADLDEIVSLLPTSGDAALNVWYTQRADYRGMMGCLLEDGTTTPPETFTTYGMTSLLYRDVTPLMPPFNALTIPFADTSGALIEMTSFGDPMDHRPLRRADQAVCIPLTFTLMRSTAVDLKAAVIVRNTLGWEIARTDAIIATADQRTTSSAVPGEMLRAFALVRLPYGAPEAFPMEVRYFVNLRVYDERIQPSGYPSRGSDALIFGWYAAAASWSAAARPIFERERLIRIGDTLTLVDYPDAIPDRARNGDTIRLSLAWIGTRNLPPLTLEGSSWSVDVLPNPSEYGNADYRLDWREIVIPADAPSGTARLTLPDGTLIREIEIESAPMITVAPPFNTPLNAEFVSAGRLIGFSADDTFTLALDQPPQVELVWDASPTTISYTVFVQMLDSGGRVIAQSDAIPGGDRPTTGWRIGEYIVDRHTLTYNALAAPGAVTLIAGLYDPATGVRVQLTGGDYVTLGTAEVR